MRGALPTVETVLDADERIAGVVPPRASASLAPDGRTAVVLAGAAAPPDDMVRAADDLKERLADGAANGVSRRRGRRPRHVGRTDAALVRMVLMPAVMRLLGPAGWWAPRWLRRVLPDIRFGH